MLKTLLDKRKCFKLICGAGNENLQEVERLVALYSAAGCHFFDLSASEEVLKAAQRGLDFSIPKEIQKDYHFCVSIGTKGDQHIQKAKINKNLCLNCRKCIEVCPQKAIKEIFDIVEKNCIGCLRCHKICENNAIIIYSSNDSLCSESIPNEILRQEPQNDESLNVSCIELHASDTDEDEVDEFWQYLNENFGGMLSICIDRSKLGNEHVLNRIKRLIKNRKPYTTIIQADGAPMSGGEDDYKTTLQAVSMAEIIQNANLPVYIMLSGGTNSKTAELARLCGVELNGIAVGSYARKIVKNYIERDDFWTNKDIFEEATKIAQGLIDYKD